MENQLMTIEAGGELSLSRPPETVLKEAEMVARPWAKKVEALKLYKTIGDRKHLQIEAWQMCAAMYRVTPRIRSTQFLDYGEVKGFEATAEAFHIPTGQVLSTADAMCLSDEDKWGPRPKYEYQGNKREQVGYVNTPLQQLRSMAQTRAMSKVLSNLFKWVAVMMGYQGTPAEEMVDEGGQGGNGGRPSGAPAAPQRRSEAGGGDGPLISEAQAKRMYAIGMKAGHTEESYIAFLKSKGYDHSRKVTRADYDRTVELLQAGPNSATSGPAKISTEEQMAMLQAAQGVGWSTQQLKALLQSRGFDSEADVTRGAYSSILDEIGKPDASE